MKKKFDELDGLILRSVATLKSNADIDELKYHLWEAYDKSIGDGTLVGTLVRLESDGYVRSLDTIGAPITNLWELTDLGKTKLNEITDNGPA